MSRERWICRLASDWWCNLRFVALWIIPILATCYIADRAHAEVARALILWLFP